MTNTAKVALQLHIVIIDDTTICMCKVAPYYSPKLGRFTQEDPARDGNNWYQYGGANPIFFVDPWGLASDNALKSTYTNML